MATWKLPAARVDSVTGGSFVGPALRGDPCRPVLGARFCPPDLGGSPIPSRFVASPAPGAVNGSGHLRAGRMGAPPTPQRPRERTPLGQAQSKPRNEGHATPSLSSSSDFIGELGGRGKLCVARPGARGIFLSGPSVGRAAHHRAARVSGRSEGATRRSDRTSPTGRIPRAPGRAGQGG